MPEGSCAQAPLKDSLDFTIFESGNVYAWRGTQSRRLGHIGVLMLDAARFPEEYRPQQALHVKAWWESQLKADPIEATMTEPNDENGDDEMVSALSIQLVTQSTFYDQADLCCILFPR